LNSQSSTRGFLTMTRRIMLVYLYAWEMHRTRAKFACSYKGI